MFHKIKFRLFRKYPRIKLPWYIRFCLLFKKWHVSIDYARGGDRTCILWMKALNGKLYVLNEEYE